MVVTQEDQAYNKIKKAISKGYIKKGSKLKEVPLSKSLDMSRATVKGAVKRLVYEGLAEHVPNKGVSVVNPTLEEINQAFQVRAQLEQMSVIQAVPNLIPEDYAALRDLVEKEEVLCRDREFQGYYEINDAFHLRIVEKSGNQVLEHYVKELLQKTTIYLILFDPFFQLIDMSNLSPAEHLEIIGLMENNNARAAGEAMKHHLASSVSGIDLERLYPSDYLSV
ncbi:MAG: GntR family transcriptional regulator [Desulfobacterales bacterium]|nr:GntR family transcriptional regulator [Desulfobacterales bacterium]